MQRKLLTTLLLAILVNLPLTAQEFTTAQIKKQIEDFKKDPRGPYQRIRWFCDDGTMREPKDPCPDAVGGVQHASYKQVTEELAASTRYCRVCAAHPLQNLPEASNPVGS